MPTVRFKGCHVERKTLALTVMARLLARCGLGGVLCASVVFCQWVPDREICQHPARAMQTPALDVELRRLAVCAGDLKDDLLTARLVSGLSLNLLEHVASLGMCGIWSSTHFAKYSMVSLLVGDTNAHPFGAAGLA